MEPMSRFSEIIDQLPNDGTREEILAALEASGITDTDELMDIVRGRNIDQATTFLKGNIHGLTDLDASALAGVLLASSGIV